MATAALRRGDLVAPVSDEEQQQLLHDIAALEEVESCSSLVLQELLERKPPFIPPALPHHFHYPTVASSPSPASLATISAALETHQSSSFASKLQQVGHSQLHRTTHSHHHHHHQPPTTPSHHPHPTLAHRHPNQHAQSYDAQHPRPRNQRCQHPIRHVEVHRPARAGCHGQPAEEVSPATLLNQVMECSTPPFATGSTMARAPPDYSVFYSMGMTLPALCSEPNMPYIKSPVSSSREAKTTSLNQVTKDFSTSGAKFPRPDNHISGTAMYGKRPGKRTVVQANKGIPANHFLTERQRREFLNEKYQVLRSLIPNPTKADRASIVQDAIDYVNELKECADMLRSKRGVAHLKRRKVVVGGLDRATDVGVAGTCKGGHELSDTSKGYQEGNTGTVSQKKSSYGTEIDVRVVANEATIKVTQHQSRRSFLLDAVLMLNEAEMELLHANGARIGNCHVYILYVKIHEIRSTHASQIAKQLLERIDASHNQATCVNEVQEIDLVQETPRFKQTLPEKNDNST